MRYGPYETQYFSECCGARYFKIIDGVDDRYECEKCGKRCILKPRNLEISVSDSLNIGEEISGGGA